MEKDTQAYRVLAVISMCGECSEKAVEFMLPEAKYRWKVIAGLEEDKAIALFSKDDVKGYRLTKRGKERMLQWEYKRFAAFLADGADFSMRRSTLGHRQRQHRISEVGVMMLKTDTTIYRDEKPPVFMGQSMQSVTITRPTFYFVREVKEQTMLTRKIGNSKLCGVWLDERQVWLCYNTGGEIPKWYDNVENRADALTRNILWTRGLQYESANAVLFGYDMSQAVLCLQDAKSRGFLLNSPFERFCYIPLDTEGSTVLKLLADEMKYESLMYSLKEDLYEAEDNVKIEIDGYNSDGEPVLISVDFDMPRLIRFEYQLRYTGKKGEVICFDFQEEAIRAYCGEQVEISTVDFKVFRDTFFPEG